MWADLLDQAEEACRKALGTAEIASVLSDLDQRGMNAPIRREALRHYSRYGRFPAQWESSVDAARAGMAEPGQFWVERALIVEACRMACSELPQAPVCDAVKELMCREFLVYAGPPERWIHHFDPALHTCRSYAAQALLERFVAGQVSWAISGIPRSLLPKLELGMLPRVSWIIARELRGFTPLVNTHITVRRVDILVQLEKEWTRSYYRIARSIERQPKVKGLFAASWLFSKETVKVTPHLDWMRKIFEENGGILVDGGAAPPSSGFLAGSALRQKLYAEGKYRPQHTLVIWPRRAMLAWANSRPDLEAASCTAR